MGRSRLIQEIRKRAEALDRSFAASQQWYQTILDEIQDTKSWKLAVADQEYQQTLTDAQRRYDRTIAEVVTALELLEDEFGLAELDWDASAWRSYAPGLDLTVPRTIRVGRLLLQGRYGSLETVALLPVIGATKNILIKARGVGKDEARQTIQSIVLRLLALLPPGKLRLICLDPVGLGSTVAGFIQDLPDILTGGRAWTESNHIEQQLANLEEHMVNVKQKYLGIRYQDIEEYNEDAGQIEEPYRLLVVSDFPERFSDSAAQRLVGIATNGPGTGVHVLAMVDTDKKTPYNFNLSDLERVSNVISYDGRSFVWDDPDYRKCRLVFDPPPAAEEFIRLLEAIARAAELLGDIAVPYLDIVSAREQWWRGDASKGIQVPIGQFGARQTQWLTFDEKLLSSALIIGRQGSGKSTLFHVLIHSLALLYSPHEVELYLLDMKQVEFKDYAQHSLPHACVVAINTEREFAISVLRRLDEELQRREDLFRDRGVVSLSSYRAKTDKRLPRVILMVDEFQELFSADDNLARDATMILDRLVRLGRAFGINVILASQTLRGGNSLPNATKDLIPMRVALQSSNTDARLILSDDNSQAALLERPGEAIYNDANGRIEGNNRFQVYWIGDSKREELLSNIGDFARDRQYSSPSPQIVFDGESQVRIENNAQLTALIENHSPPDKQRVYSAWLGEPVAIKPHTAAVFRKQSGSNLLIVGQREYEESAYSIISSTILSLAAQHRVDEAEFVVLNFGDYENRWHGLPNSVSQCIPHRVEVVDTRRQVLPAILRIYHDLQTRVGENQRNTSSIYLFLIGLQNMRDIRWPDGYYYSERQPDEPVPPSVQLRTICREGPELGVYVTIWCDTLSRLEKALDRSAQNEFDMRVTCQMNPNDSRTLLDSEVASRVGPYRALYIDVERMTQPEKFRPYALPSEGLLQQIGKKLAARK